MSAIVDMWLFRAKLIWVPPNPRKAPRGMVCVWIIRAWLRTFSSRCMLSLRMAVTSITSGESPA